ncbi:MAG: hypothetical protein IPJ69_13900 [Deltaproteobacteria bacterium]|nr:MAG: hypothetical protein IPJ69_13900 [Deltaproteobacteria bacterium]
MAPLREVIIETTALAYMPSEFYDLAPTNLLHLTQEELLNAFNKRSAEEWIITTDDGMQQIQDKITADTLKAHAQGKRNLTRAAPKTRSTVATMLSPLGLALLELAPLLPLLEIKVDKTDFHNRPYFKNSPTCIFIHNKDISRLQETTVDRKAADIHEFPIKDLLDPGQPLDELLDEVEGRLQALITFGQSPHDIVSLLSEDLTLETALKRVSRMRVALKNETGKVTAYLDPEVRKAMPLNTLDKAAKAARHIIMFAWDLRASEVTTLYESLPSESGQKTNKYTVHFVDDWPDDTTPLEARFEGFNFYLPTRLLKALHQQKNIQAQDLLRLHITYLLAKEAVTENDIEKLIEQLFPSMSADKRQSLAERYRALRLELKSQPASVRYSLKSKDNQEALDKRRRQSDSQKGKKHEDKDSGESQKQTKAETVEDFVCPPKQELPTRLQDSLSQKLLSAFAAREAGEISEESIKELCRAIPIEWITSKKIPEASTRDLFMNERIRQRFQFLGVPIFTDTSRPKAQKILENYINFLRNSYRTFQKDKPASVNIQQMIDLTLARSLRQDEPVDLILCARQVLGETAPIIALEDLARHYERCHAEQSKTYRDKFGGFSEYLGIWNDENPECLQKDVVSELIKESLLTQSYTPQNSEHIETTPPLSALAESIFYEGSESEATQRWAEVLKIIEQHPKEKKAELPERKFKSLEWILPEATSLVKKLETLYQKGSSKKYIFIAESAAGGAVGEMEIIQIDRLDELVMIDGQTIAPNQIHFMHEDITTADTENQKRLFKTSADDLAVLFSYYFRSLPNTSSLDILKSALRGNLTPLELRNHLNNLLQNTASDPTRFLIGNLAMTQFWPDPVRSHKESVTIEKDMMAYLWLRRTGADFCIEGTEEEIRVKRNSLRAALLTLRLILLKLIF